MKIAMVGYGKMGHNIVSAAQKRGHEVCMTIDLIANDAMVKTSVPSEIAKAVVSSGAEGVIEFTHPTAVVSNLKALIPTHIPLVVGTTGWHSLIDEVSGLVKNNKTHLLYSSNFSIGVNLFYRIVEEASRLMNDFSEYDVSVLEMHHNQKADSPSGTALEIAKRIMQNIVRKNEVVSDSFSRVPKANELHVASVRVGSVPGTHTVTFDSAADTIELTHTARNRDSLALGAVRSLEWLVEGIRKNNLQSGVFTMSDIL